MPLTKYQPLSAEELAVRRAHAARMRELEATGTPHEWAVEYCRGYLEGGWQPVHLVAIEGSGGALAYHYQTRHGKMLITRFHGKLCHHSFPMKRLVEEAQARIAGVPQQATLFATE